MDRPFRILKPSHKEPENSRKNAPAATPEKPIDQQLREDFLELERKAEAFRADKMRSPQHVEERCSQFEKDWTEKLEQRGMQAFIDPMKAAVDAIRNGEKPDVTFTMEMRPAFKLTPETTRRMAGQKSRDREDWEM